MSETDVDVDMVFPNRGLPQLFGRLSFGDAVVDQLAISDQVQTPGHGLSALQQAVIAELADTARSIRTSDRPRSLLHTLFLNDGLVLGEIAGITQRETDEVELPLLWLVDAGWVVRRGEGAAARYYIRGLDEE